jgi:2-amino-4-hydroxy-6-hydroxymethyldihydropteridine diphosphokinase
MGATELALPAWARASPARRAHIGRVTTLLLEWADAMHLGEAERASWRDAGLWHDALRDAPHEELRALLGDTTTPAPLLHGPAAARRCTMDGEQRTDVLLAVAHHTVGCASWERTGRALYLADYLEPGRPIARRRRAVLARRVPADFESVFRDVVRERLEWMLHEGVEIAPETVTLWNSLQ